MKALHSSNSCRLQHPSLCFTPSFFLSQFSSVHLLSRVRLFVTPWTAACQASLYITNSQSLSKLMSIESVMPSNHLILCCNLQCFPASGSFPMRQFFTLGSQSIGEGNGNPLQYSCLENPMDRGAWWAAVHWVARSRT